MTNLTLWDHAFAVLVFIVFPSYGKYSFKNELARIRSGGESARVSAYQNTIATWVTFSITVLLMWLLLDRPWGDLGIRWPDLVPTVIGFFVAAALVMLLVQQLRTILVAADGQEQLESQLGDLATLMPKSGKDVSWFTALSANAGISEELIFRGYLIWYLQHVVGLWTAAAASVLLFGFAHAYQGWKQLPGILFVSAAATGLYLYTGSLLLPILFHFAVDAVQGVYIARIQNPPLENN